MTTPNATLTLTRNDLIFLDVLLANTDDWVLADIHPDTYASLVAKVEVARDVVVGAGTDEETHP